MVADSPKELEARYPVSVFFQTFDVSNLSMILSDTTIEALDGHELPRLSGTREFYGVGFGAELLHVSHVSLFVHGEFGGSGGDDAIQQAPIGCEGDMLDLELSSLVMASAHAGIGYSVDVGSSLALYARAFAGARGVTRTATVSFMDSEIGTESAGDWWFDAGAEVGARLRLSDHYDVWAGWNEHLPRAGGLVIGVGYYTP